MEFSKSPAMKLQATSSWCESLRNVESSNDSEVLGTDEYSESEDFLRCWKIKCMPLDDYINAKSITLRDGLECIGNTYFYESDIRKLVVPKSVTEVGKCAFQECKVLKWVSF